MPDALTFEEFVTTRSPAFLRLAYALTRNHAHAEDLLQTALARTWPAWKRISGDPEPYVRRVLVNTHNSWWRRRWNGEQATGEVPETPSEHPQSTVDERDQVWRALARLPKRQRAVLVLRFFEDLSEAQIAETLAMAPGTVKSYAAKGLAQLRNDPSLLTVPPAPGGVERLTAVKERIKQRRRTRAITLAAAIVALIALLIGSSPAVRRQSLEPAGPGGFPQYLTGYRIVAGQQVSFGQIRSGASFTWTPGSMVPSFFATCAHTDPDGWRTEIGIEINGRGFGGIGCVSNGDLTGHSMLRMYEETIRLAGGELGVPVQVKIVFNGDDGTIPRDGTAKVGIGEPVPWKSYPFPKRPERLETLDRQEFNRYQLDRQPMMEAGGAHSVVLDWGVRHDVYARSQTPGRLDLHINGVLVQILKWWDYKATGQHMLLDWDRLGPAPVGQVTATLTVTPEDMSGDWVVGIRAVSG